MFYFSLLLILIFAGAAGLMMNCRVEPEIINPLPGYDLTHTSYVPSVPLDKRVVIVYTNWKGLTAERIITPGQMFWGSTSYHPDLQWLMTAYDQGKQDERVFAVKDIKSWRPYNGKVN